MNKFHSAFNGELWENVSSEVCLDWFKQSPIGKPIFRKDMKRYFCYAVSKIDGHLIAARSPKNFEVWMRHHIGKNNYSSLKNTISENKKKSKIVAEKKRNIDDKIALF